MNMTCEMQLSRVVLHQRASWAYSLILPVRVQQLLHSMLPRQRTTRQSDHNSVRRGTQNNRTCPIVFEGKYGSIVGQSSSFGILRGVRETAEAACTK